MITGPKDYTWRKGAYILAIKSQQELRENALDWILSQWSNISLDENTYCHRRTLQGYRV